MIMPFRILFHSASQNAREGWEEKCCIFFSEGNGCLFLSNQATRSFQDERQSLPNLARFDPFTSYFLPSPQSKFAQPNVIFLANLSRFWAKPERRFSSKTVTFHISFPYNICKRIAAPPFQAKSEILAIWILYDTKANYIPYRPSNDEGDPIQGVRYKQRNHGGV